MSITAILVTYNSAEVIAGALTSLIDSPEVSEIVVVDNASTDATKTLIAEQFPKVKIIPLEENIGFGRGNNVALAQVTTPYALLLNPDARLDKNAAAEMLKTAERYNEAAIIAPLLYDDKNAPYESYKRSVFMREKDGGIFILPEGECSAAFLSGACWLLRMSAFKDIGFFDERIFLFYEDDDLCLRAQKTGASCVLTPYAKAVHFLGKSTADKKINPIKQYHLAKSRVYLEQKYYGAKRAQLLQSQLLIQYGLKVLANALLLRGKKSMKSYYRLRGAQAALDFWPNPTASGQSACDGASSKKSCT